MGIGTIMVFLRKTLWPELLSPLQKEGKLPYDLKMTYDMLLGIVDEPRYFLEHKHEVKPLLEKLALKLRNLKVNKESTVYERLKKKRDEYIHILASEAEKF